MAWVKLTLSRGDGHRVGTRCVGTRHAGMSVAPGGHSILTSGRKANDRSCGQLLRHVHGQMVRGCRRAAAAGCRLCAHMLRQLSGGLRGLLPGMLLRLG